MGKKVPLEQLQVEINKILEKYGENVNQNVQEITKEFAKKGAKAISGEAKSKFGGTGKYASGWTSQVEEKRMTTQGIIYNKTPGLPHLLENGHANRGGGRTPGRSHIAPVEEKLIAEFTKAVEKAV